MRSIPLPLRVAAGLAATAVEQARELPTKLAGLPVTVASQALQLSMRVQQHVTELAIKGDEVLAGLHPVEETPEWATFDEDLEEERYDADRPAPFDRVTGDWPDLSPNGHDAEEAADPWSLEEQALAEETAQDIEQEEHGDGPAGVANYDELSLPQLRARLRRFTVEELEALLEHERTNANRPAFVGMLTRRIATVRDHHQ
jgi:hypothetical protein